VIFMAFDTSILDRALAQRQATYEKKRQEKLAQVLQLLDELAPDYGIQQAYLFGSLTIPGRFRPTSDVDIAVEQIDPSRFFEAAGKFSARLGCEVDLIELSKCHFADKIRQEGIQWIQSD
jgi:predicted nucleotidyltransferase